MDTITRTPEQALAYLRDIQARAEAYIEGSDRAACDRAGRNLAAMVTTGQYADVASGLAAILEWYRAAYRQRFATTTPSPVPARSAHPRGYGPSAERQRELVEGQPALPAMQRELPLGTFTVEFPDGDYRTIEFERVAEGALAGRVVASFLRGPDNERDFQGFAFVEQRQGRVEVRTWRRFAGIDQRWQMAALIAADSTPEEARELGKAYAMRSGRCARCGRKLTTPASLIERQGIGPECWKKMGM